MSRARFQTALLISGFVASACLYVLTVDPRIGEGYDDSHYLTLARALASGQGFTTVYSDTLSNIEILRVDQNQLP